MINNNPLFSASIQMRSLRLRVLMQFLLKASLKINQDTREFGHCASRHLSAIYKKLSRLKAWSEGHFHFPEYYIAITAK
jgi:hypothetical protein